MERPSFSRQETDAVGRNEKPTGNSSGFESRDSKESVNKEKVEYNVSDHSPSPPYHDHEAFIGEGEIRNLDTAEDIVTTVIHVEDDPTLNPWTFRMFFIGKFF